MKIELLFNYEADWGNLHRARPSDNMSRTEMKVVTGVSVTKYNRLDHLPETLWYACLTSIAQQKLCTLGRPVHCTRGLSKTKQIKSRRARGDVGGRTQSSADDPCTPLRKILTTDPQWGPSGRRHLEAPQSGCLLKQHQEKEAAVSKPWSFSFNSSKCAQHSLWCAAPHYLLQTLSSVRKNLNHWWQ